MANPDWEDIDPDALMKSARQHDWMAEPRFKRMFEEIEDKLQGVLGSGQYDWVDRRVFDAVFDRSTLLSLHKLMQAGEIETVDYPIARGKEAHVFHATTNQGPAAVNHDSINQPWLLFRSTISVRGIPTWNLLSPNALTRGRPICRRTGSD